MIEVGANVETVAGGGSLGALIMSLWTQYRQATSRKTMWSKIDAVDQKVDNKFEKLQETINEHEVNDARLYATRDDITDLRDFIDKKVSEQTRLIIDLMRDGNGRKHD